MKQLGLTFLLALIAFVNWKHSGGKRVFVEYGVDELVRIFPAILQALSLSISRWLGFGLFFPAFSRRHLGSVQRNAVCFALSLPQCNLIYAQIRTADISATWLVVLATKEVVLGALLGILLAIPFWVCRAALTLVDNQRGANAAQMANPSLEADSSILGEFGERLFVVWLIETGSLVFAFEAIADSTLFWPVIEAWPSSLFANPQRLWAIFSGLMSATLLFAAPVLILLLVVEFAMALSSISVKGIDVYQTAMPVKGIAAVLFLAVAGNDWLSRGIEQLTYWWRHGFRSVLGV